MRDREKLIELMEQAYFCSIDNLADHLLANGVVVREKGEWMPHFLLGQRVWDCSNCKTLGVPHWVACPVCGADMRKGENG